MLQKNLGSSKRAHPLLKWSRSEPFGSIMRHHSGKPPKNYRRSDERVREDVCEALTRDPHVDPSDVDVVVRNGIVTLKGTIESRLMKRRAEDAILDVPGVDDVDNELRIGTSRTEKIGEQNRH